jgi:hypothetical protein
LLGSIKYTAAIEVLRIFEGRLTRLKDEHDRVRKAKAALDLEQHAEDDRLQPIEEEMQDLKGVFLKCFFPCLSLLFASFPHIRLYVFASFFSFADSTFFCHFLRLSFLFLRCHYFSFLAFLSRSFPFLRLFFSR